VGRRVAAIRYAHKLSGHDVPTNNDAPFELGEDAITALVPQGHERVGEEVVILHEVASSDDRLGIEPASAG
jgi:hypothetical protein